MQQVLSEKTAQRFMTYPEFLTGSNEDTHAEWVNGEVIEFMPPKNLHQMLIKYLSTIIQIFADVFDLGQVRTAPFQLKLYPESSGREPDLIFLKKEHLARLTEDRVEGNPDLIIEIVSTDSTHRDRVDKFDEYEAGGVPEYWIIDNRPGRRRAQFYQLDEKGEYQAVKADSKGIYHAQVLPGFWLNVNWLWEEQPNELRALALVVGPHKLQEAMERLLESDS